MQRYAEIIDDGETGLLFQTVNIKFIFTKNQNFLIINFIFNKKFFSFSKNKILKKILVQNGFISHANQRQKYRR